MELPLLDDLDCVSAVKEAMELQVEACMKEEDEVEAASSSDTSLRENPEMEYIQLEAVQMSYKFSNY